MTKIGTPDFVFSETNHRCMDYELMLALKDFITPELVTTKHARHERTRQTFE